MINALEISELHKTYKNGVQALSGINLEVKQGDFLHCLAQMEQVNQLPLVLLLP